MRLEIGRTYFQLTFADPGMTMPGVEPLVYLGDTDPVDGKAHHIFQDTVSYSRFGSRLNMLQDHSEVTVYFISSEEVGSAILGVQQLAQEVTAAAQRASEMGNPLLRGPSKPEICSGFQ